MPETKDTQHELVPQREPPPDRGVPPAAGEHEPKGLPDAARHQTETATETGKPAA